MMKRRLYVSVLLVGIVLGLTSNVMAEYSVSWFNVGGRHYENGNYVNRLNLELFDENGLTPTVDIIVPDSVTLMGPTGEITLETFSFYSRQFMSYRSYYDGWGGLWYHEGYFDEPYGDYNAPLPDTLQTGTYTLTFTDINGKFHTATKEYTGKKNMPIISSSSIKGGYDHNGNLSISWTGIKSKIPYVIDPNMQTSIRVCIGSDQSWWQMHIPAHMNTAFIPSDIIREIKSVGSGNYLLIQYRQQTNCNRSYSNPIYFDRFNGQP
jgi:hypothetical protein